MIVTASILNVRSGPGLDFRVNKQLRRGDGVVVIETRGDWAAIEPCGWVHRAYLEPSRIEVPNGLQEIVARFGDPGSREASAGRVILPAPLKVGWMSASITRFACHIELEAVFTGVYAEIHRLGLWEKLETYDGCYNDRDVKHGGKKSTHAWGISVDHNAATNRMNRRGDMDIEIVKIFNRHGFHWLGPTHDPMHFQFATGY